jgi:hypothetical protein
MEKKGLPCFSFPSQKFSQMGIGGLSQPIRNKLLSLKK